MKLPIYKEAVFAACLIFILLLVGCGSTEPIEANETIVEEVEVEATSIAEVTVVEEAEVKLTRSVESTEEVEAEELVADVVVPVPASITSTSALAEKKGIATIFSFDETVTERTLVGLWYNIGSTLIFGEDGNWVFYDIGVLDVSEEKIFDGGTYTIEDDTLVWTTAAGNTEGCVEGSVGTYEVEWLESGGFDLKLIEDDCVNRGEFYSDERIYSTHLPISSSQFLAPLDDFEPMGETRVLRSDKFVRINLSATSISYANQALTSWIFVFNEPTLCEAGPYQCGLADLGSNRAAQGDFLLLGDDGDPVGEDGIHATSFRLSKNNTGRSGLLFLPNGCPVGYSDCGLPVGLTNVDDALFYIAIRSHGPALEGELLDSQLTSLYGGCDMEIGSGLLGFAVDSAEYPNETGECAFIAFSQHAPNQ